MQIQGNNINYSSNIQQRKSFGAKQLDTLKLLKKVQGDVYTPIKATFSELDVNNASDIALIKKLKDSWKDATEYGQEICNGFLQKLKDSRFFVTEAIDGNSKKVTNIMQVLMPKPNSYSNGLEIKYMQSAPDIANKMSASPIKGSGETALYELTKLCEKEGRDGYNFLSTADNFYEKLGMTDLGSYEDIRIFGLPQKRFQWFMDKIAKKYNL